MSDLAADLDAIRASIKKTQAKILTIDIERLPGLAYAWEPKTRYIPPRNFIEWPRMVCFAARWYGQKRVIFEAEWKDRDRMIERAWSLYDEADIVITFNGIRFDNKHLKSDWLLAGMAPPLPWKDLDLFQVAKQFGFESKSLDSLTRRLGRPGKELHYSLETTLAAVEGDRDAQRELTTYNHGDIELTEWLHDRLIGWMPAAPFKGTHGDEKVCNQCGSHELTHVPNQRYRAVVLDYALYRCDNCGGVLRAGWVARAGTTRGVR